MTTPTSPRYVVRKERRPISLRFCYAVFDRQENIISKTKYIHKRNAEKQCDRLNSAILKQAHIYRKAKDNG